MDHESIDKIMQKGKEESSGLGQVRLDRSDILILHQLDLNCRSSFNQIGKKARHSKEFIRYRFARLVEKGVISQFITSVDYSRLGMSRICFYVKFHEMTAKIRSRIEQYRKEMDCRIKMFSVGKFDLYVDITLQAGVNVDSIAHGFISVFGETISEMSMNSLYRIKHFKNRYLYGRLISRPFTSDYLDARYTPILDDEMMILDLLRQSPRESIISIAERCSLSPKSVVTKMNKLARLGIITGYCIKLNNQIIGKEDYIILLKLNDKSVGMKTKIESYLETITEVSYMGLLIGEYDLEFAITVDSQSEFMLILDRMRSNLKKEIRDLNVLFLSHPDSTPPQLKLNDTPGHPDEK